MAHDHSHAAVEGKAGTLQRAMRWSMAVGILLLAVKVGAAWATGSTALYADAAESVAHVLATGFAAFALRFSRKPADATHHFGHDKAAFISSGLEGAMVAATALLVGGRAVVDLIEGPEVGRLGLGAVLAGVAASVNAALGLWLVALGRRHRDRVVRANGTHVLADVWTTGAGLAALGLVALTGESLWDPLIALVFGAWVLWQGLKLVREAFDGLMDRADSDVATRLERVLSQLQAEGPTRFDYHHLRHRDSGHAHWVELHLVFADELDLVQAHARATEIEQALAAELGELAQIITHLEPWSALGRDQPWETPPGEGGE